MKIKRSWSIDYIFEHRINEPLAERDSPVEVIPQFFIKIKFVPDSGDIGDSKEADSEFKGVFLEPLLVFLFAVHETILAAPLEAVNGS